MLVRDSVFLADVVLLVGYDQLEQWHKLNKLPIEKEKTLAGFVSRVDKTKNGVTERIYLVFIEKANDFYCLMHETIHLAEHILTDRGIKINLSDDSEVFAYYHSFWFKKLWRAINTKGTIRTSSPS